jgi:SAM-dependent methyltransferase
MSEYKGYQSRIFDPATLQHAKDVVLTPDENFPNKFEVTTKYFVDVLDQESLINDDSIVLDFGVGMGRITKEILSRHNCKIVGTDQSLNMLIHATQYINDTQRFVTCNRVTYPNAFDICIAVFVLQHVEDPVKEIENIFDVVRPNGHLILLNDPKHRYVPGDWREDESVIWFDDYFDIFTEIEKRFVKVKEIPYLDTDHKTIIYKKP